MLKKKIFINCFIYILFLCCISDTFFGETKNIFFLHSNADSYPVTRSVNEGIEEVLQSNKNWVLYSEYMDFPRIRDPMINEGLLKYIDIKYRTIEFDAVCAEGLYASRFINKYGKDIFGDIPIVLHTFENNESSVNTLLLQTKLNEAVLNTFEMAFDQNPDRGEIVVIYNSPDLFLSQKDNIGKLDNYNNRIITEITDFTIDELKQLVEALSGNEIIFYFPVSVDKKGETYIPRQVLAELAAISPSPIYSFWSTFINTGCVGGIMVDSRKSTLQMFNAIDDFFQNGKFSEEYSGNQAFLDWNASISYKLNIRTLPEDIIILNEPVPIYKNYFKEIVIAFSVFLLLVSGLIAFFLYRINKDQKRNNKNLKRLNTMLNTASEVGKIVFWEFDNAAKTTIWSDSVFSIFEIDIKEPGIDFLKFFSVLLLNEYFSENEYSRIKNEYEKSLKEKRDFYTTFKCNTNKRNIKIIEGRATHHFGEKGEYIKTVGSLLDATEQAEKENLQHRARLVQEQNEELRVTLNSMAEGVITTDTKFRIKKINKYAELVTGWSGNEVLGKELDDILPLYNENSESHSISIKEFHTQANQFSFPGSLYFTRKDNDIRNLLISASYFDIEDSEVKGYVFVFQDNTERERFLQEIQKIEKFNSLGILAGGIAHDFNNLLSVIYGHMELIKANTADPKKIKKYLDNTLHSFEQAKKLTQQLITFSKDDDFTIEDGNLVEVIRQCIDFVLTGTSIQPAFQFDDDLWTVKFDKCQIEQVIENLLINSKQAMNDTGNIFISLENQVLTRTEFPQLENSGYYLHLTVQDDGPGISKGDLSKIFDPFFTTKETGTGLGLATTYSIIKKHGGLINVESSIGEGTSFHIYFPAVKKSFSSFSQNMIHDENAKMDNSKGDEIVIIMDDEAFLGELGSIFLNSAGFKTIAASKGEQVIDICKKLIKDKEPLKAVLLDLTIVGGLGGVETAKELRKFLPISFPIIAVSGYSNDPVVSKPHEFGFTDSLSKPFLKNELIQKVRAYI